MRKILLDTSFLVKCAEYHIDLFTEIDRLLREPYQLYAVSGTNEELTKLAIGDTLRTRHARLAIAFMKRVHVLEVAGGFVDDRLVQAVQNDSRCIVATHDAELKRRVRALGAARISIRQKQYLILE